MHLTNEQRKMLEGDYGFPAKKSMEILVQLGIIYGAEKMIPISSVHMPGSSAVVAGEAGTRLVEKMAQEGGKFVVPTTLNTGALDFSIWEELGYSKEIFEHQTRLTEAYKVLGAVPIHTCTPYLAGVVPRLGEHIGWGESSAIAYVNSVLGARTNREGGPSALAEAITGFAPAYGFHLDDHRVGQILIEVNTDLVGIDDYGSLGYWVGTRVESKVPVFTGIPKNVTNDQLKMLSAALASSGSVALYHVVGVTPEAPTLEAAFGKNKALCTYQFSAKEKEESIEKLNKHQNQDVSLVVIGCPHTSVEEIEIIVDELKKADQKLKSSLWVLTSVACKAVAQRCGYLETIEKYGGKVVIDTCPILSPMQEIAQRNKYTSIATNSAKLAHYAPGQWALPTYYGSLSDCIHSALTGKYEARRG